jgi:hypothetical protein
MSELPVCLHVILTAAPYGQGPLPPSTRREDTRSNLTSHSQCTAGRGEPGCIGAENPPLTQSFLSPTAQDALVTPGGCTDSPDPRVEALTPGPQCAWLWRQGLYTGSKVT